jgi:hypothetical protein
MIVSAVLAASFGVGFLLFPQPLASLYGLDLTTDGAFIARLLGVEFIGYGLLAWFFRNEAHSNAGAAVLLAFFITDATAFIVSLVAQLSGIMNAFGWSLVGVYFLLAMGFGYFRFVKSGES